MSADVLTDSEGFLGGSRAGCVADVGRVLCLFFFLQSRLTWFNTSFKSQYSSESAPSLKRNEVCSPALFIRITGDHVCQAQHVREQPTGLSLRYLTQKLMSHTSRGFVPSGQTMMETNRLLRETVVRLYKFVDVEQALQGAIFKDVSYYFVC